MVIKVYKVHRRPLSVTILAFVLFFALLGLVRNLRWQSDTCAISISSSSACSYDETHGGELNENNKKKARHVSTAW